jgi:hypothetical protein
MGKASVGVIVVYVERNPRVTNVHKMWGGTRLLE